MFYAGVGVDEFVGASFLSSPLQIVADAYVGHPHVHPHVLFVAVPLAERSGALVVFAEGDDHSCLELPVFPIILSRYDIEVFAPADFLAPEIALGLHILHYELESLIHEHHGDISAPVMVVERIGVSFHAFGLILYGSRQQQPVRDDLYLLGEPETQILQPFAVFIRGDEPVIVPVEIRGDGIGACECSCPERSADTLVEEIMAVAECQHIGRRRFQIGIAYAPLEAVELLGRDIGLGQ